MFLLLLFLSKILPVWQSEEICPGGEYKKNYFPEQYSSCEICDIGFYCPNISNSMIICNENSTTLSRGASLETDCLCLEGFYKDLNINSCTKCPYNSFKSNIGDGYCDSCPDQFSTHDIGSTSIEDCKKNLDLNEGSEKENQSYNGNSDFNLSASSYLTNSLGNNLPNKCGDNFVEIPSENGDKVCVCKKGYEYNSNQNICEPCKINYYKESFGNDRCIKCPRFSETNNTGSICASKCKCSETFIEAHDNDNNKVCICDRGSELDNNLCDLCKTGSFKPSIGNEKCTD
ncbi:MAG: hypothetical protein MHPSP_003250, partial [Paramarteilia canceri]